MVVTSGSVRPALSLHGSYREMLGPPGRAQDKGGQVCSKDTEPEPPRARGATGQMGWSPENETEGWNQDALCAQLVTERSMGKRRSGEGVNLG